MTQHREKFVLCAVGRFRRLTQVVELIPCEHLFRDVRGDHEHAFDGAFDVPEGRIDEVEVHGLGWPFSPCQSGRCLIADIRRAAFEHLVQQRRKDLIAEFRALAPPRDPIPIQRWSLRRLGLVVGSLVVGLLLTMFVLGNLLTIPT